MSKSIDLSYWEYRVKGNWERWDWEDIYRNRKADQLNTHGGSEEVEDHSWREKAKVLGCFLKKMVKSPIDKDRLINRL